MQKATLRMLLMAVLISGSTQAQQQLQLSLEDAITTGLQNSKVLSISAAKVRAAEAKLKETDAGHYPTLKLSAAYTRLSKVDPFAITTPFGSFTVSPAILDNYNAKLSLQQPLFTGFRLQNSSRVADINSQAASEEMTRDKAEVIFTIRNAYWNHYKAIAMKRLIDETVEQVKLKLQDAKNLAAQGLLTRNDVLKFEVQLSNTLYQQAEAGNAVVLSMIALNNAMNTPLMTDITLTSNASEGSGTIDKLEDLLVSAYRQRPELKAAGLRVEAGKSGVEIAKGGWYPQVALSGNYTYAKPNQRIVPAKNQFDGTWDVTLGLSMDLWNWNTTGYQSEQAEAQLTQAKDALETIKDGVTLEVTQNFLNARQAREKLTIARLAVSQAEENNRITGEKFKNGLATSSDVIDAEVALLQAKTNYTNALVDYELATARLKKSSGE